MSPPDLFISNLYLLQKKKKRNERKNENTSSN